jgi:hypothetical protein
MLHPHERHEPQRNEAASRVTSSDACATVGVERIAAGRAVSVPRRRTSPIRRWRAVLRSACLKHRRAEDAASRASSA